MDEHQDIVSTDPTVLVVDDDPAVRNSLKFSLQVEGFSVRAYANGDELLGDPALPGTGCLIIDYQLPGMNGLDVVATLRRRHVLLPVILITTSPSATLRTRASEAGIAVVEKPLLGDALLQCVRDTLAQTHEIPDGGAGR